MAAGLGEIAGGFAGEEFGLALDATGIGAIAGIPINLASAGIIEHGFGTSVDSVHNLGNDARDLFTYFKSGSKPNQVHHFLTNKSKTYTKQFEKITRKYGLNLDDVWNKKLMPHQGRHPNAYHEYILEQVKKFDHIAKGDKNKFLKLFNQLKQKIVENPGMLYKDYWEK